MTHDAETQQWVLSVKSPENWKEGLSQAMRFSPLQGELNRPRMPEIEGLGRFAEPSWPFGALES